MSITSNFPAIKPTLLLDFANVKQLDPRITFTRASTATYYGTQTAKAEENLILYSEQLSNGAGWSTSNITADGDTDTAPNGTITADRITSNSTPTQCGISSITATFSASQPLTVSVFAKAGSATFLQIFIPTSVLSGGYANFNLSTGAVGNFGGTGLTASIVSVGNSWYRCSVSIASVSASATDAATFYMVDSATAARGANFSTNSQQLLLWGAQVEQRNAVSGYTLTTIQRITNYIPVLETAASGVARFGHNPTTFESLGLLIEEQRTNLLTYSEQFDNVAWTKTQSSIVSNTVVAPTGLLTGDLHLPNTTAAEHSISQNFSFVSGTTYTLSIYLKAAGYTQCRIRFQSGAFGGTAQSIDVDLVAGTAVSASGSPIPTITNVGNGWYRVTSTATAAATISAAVSVFPIIGGSTTGAGDGYSGIYIWGAQLEAGAFVTSYIPTVASQVTRAADAASMTGTNFSSWYNATEGTWFADFTPPTSDYLANKNLFLASDGTTSNFNGLRYVTSGSRPGLGVTTAGTTQASIATTAMVANTAYKMAGAYKLNDFAVSRNGAAVVTDASGTIPTVTQAEIGMLAGTSFGSQTIKKLAYYPIRITNAQLQALTS